MASIEYHPGISFHPSVYYTGLQEHYRQIIKIIHIIFSMAVLFLSLIFPSTTFAIDAGVAVTDISPPLGVPLWGYASRTEPADGVFDPLYAKAIVFDDGQHRAAIISLDLGRTFPDAQNQWLRDQLQEQYNLSQTLVTATHTHAAPRFDASDQVNHWTEEILNEIITLVGQAIENRQPAKFYVANGEVDITYDRRIVNDSTVTMLWSNFERQPTTPVDQGVRVVYIKDANDQLMATMVHYACHPVMTGNKNYKITADFSAYMCAHVEEEIGGTCVYIQGACGNINPYMAAIVSEVADGYETMQEDGRTVGKEVVRLYDEAQLIEAEDFTIRYVNETYSYPLRYPLEDERIKNLYQGLYGEKEVAAVASQEKIVLPTEISILTLGNTFAWAGFPGEFFDAFQIDLRQRSPLPHTFFVGYCNGYNSYFPTIKAAAEGGYGAGYGTLVATGAGEHLVDRAIIALYKLNGRLEGK